MQDRISPNVELPLQKTPLHAFHVRHGARMVEFAQYHMPLHYSAGIVKEHLHTRKSASLFDVSHMGQALLSHPEAGRKLERCVPGDLCGLASGRMRYTQLLSSEGTILDDLMVTRLANIPDSQGTAEKTETLFLVVNAGKKIYDFNYITAQLPEVKLTQLPQRALLALQGPKAALLLAPYFPDILSMPFMSLLVQSYKGEICYVSRSGYTGEDGFEISLPEPIAEAFAENLLQDSRVQCAGLGARDSLRLEAGFCLYGHDIYESVTPVEANLLWSISPRRQKEGGFLGAARIQQQIEEGVTRQRVGLILDGKIPAREGAILLKTGTEQEIGQVTSGNFGLSLGQAIAMAYIESGFSKIGTQVDVIVRHQRLKASVSALPFVPHRYFKSKGGRMQGYMPRGLESQK